MSHEESNKCRLNALQDSVGKLKNSIQRTASSAAESLREATACMEAAEKLRAVGAQYAQAADNAKERFTLTRHGGRADSFGDKECISLLLHKADIVALFASLVELQVEKAAALESQARLTLERMEW